MGGFDADIEGFDAPTVQDMTPLSKVVMLLLEAVTTLLENDASVVADDWIHIHS